MTITMTYQQMIAFAVCVVTLIVLTASLLRFRRYLRERKLRIPPPMLGSVEWQEEQYG